MPISVFPAQSLVTAKLRIFAAALVRGAIRISIGGCKLNNRAKPTSYESHLFIRLQFAKNKQDVKPLVKAYYAGGSWKSNLG